MKYSLMILLELRDYLILIKFKTLNISQLPVYFNHNKSP